ncbi:MAG: rhomboid family intramembrane serine protease [Paracoccaceae bacterium]|nr:rhomboid family intramembrane serine protease [Paracoccaceae bacterium]
MQDQNFTQPVFNALPPAVVALALAIFGVEMLLWLGARGIIGGPQAVGWRLEAIQEFSFFSPVLAWVFETGNWSFEHLKRFVTYPFIHGGFTHAAFVIVFLLALGKLVGEVFGNLAVIVLFFACGIFGALIYAGLVGDDRPLIGGFPSVYGLIGAYTFLLWVRFKSTGENEYQAFTLIGFLLGIQLFFGIFFNVGFDWVAEVAGFIFGFVLTPALVPGAFRRFMDRIRQR